MIRRVNPLFELKTKEELNTAKSFFNFDQSVAVFGGCTWMMVRIPIIGKIIVRKFYSTKVYCNELLFKSLNMRIRCDEHTFETYESFKTLFLERALEDLRYYEQVLGTSSLNIGRMREEDRYVPKTEISLMFNLPPRRKAEEQTKIASR